MKKLITERKKEKLSLIMIEKLQFNDKKLNLIISNIINSIVSLKIYTFMFRFITVLENTSFFKYFNFNEKRIKNTLVMYFFLYAFVSRGRKIFEGRSFNNEINLLIENYFVDSNGYDLFLYEVQKIDIDLTIYPLIIMIRNSEINPKYIDLPIFLHETIKKLKLKRLVKKKIS